MQRVRVIGGGLAGCEAALQLACRGFQVDLFEMRPHRQTPAHRDGKLAQLVCSNSFKGLEKTSAHGLLKNELKLLGSFLLKAAESARVPAGESLTVDRDVFSDSVERLILAAPNITLHRDEVTTLESEFPTLVAAGPLASEALTNDIFSRLGSERLHFFDAIAPVIEADSIDMSHAFFRNRWEKGETADFINCPLDKETYDLFVAKLREADSVELKPFEKKELFEGCLPVEEMARRGTETLRFGPMRPVGLGLGNNGKKWYAVIQLRAENKQKTLFNMVGFQTRLKWGVQKEIFTLVPALKNAVFARFGCMHRNTFIESPKLLTDTLRLRGDLPGTEHLPPIWFAGQITGAEGYTEAIATGWYAAWNMAQTLLHSTPTPLPEASCIGSLMKHLTSENEDFQPMNFNFGLLPHNREYKKKEKKTILGTDAENAVRRWIASFTNLDSTKPSWSFEDRI
ncbi:MAG: methylenetetrahydrofolate--tRNA-(uracil(54)-C(5))-methyltransferase (FADH(2)-oxidizing) TrmFO [Fibrobacter sp.]|jgi:methylenetetrahydrofolate--tRNA-(uracil-5-)-methyltransferase|nr:methylenetetrahydrofolate--tRNA-(uracil(54)-C(5))-methyltransferase (FADH(2)-oxidizing) TrmFO [Fibrobacter sp.]